MRTQSEIKIDGEAVAAALTRLAAKCDKCECAVSLWCCLKSDGTMEYTAFIHADPSACSTENTPAEAVDKLNYDQEKAKREKIAELREKIAKLEAA